MLVVLQEPSRAVLPGTHGKASTRDGAVRICDVFSLSTCWSTQILRLLVAAAIRKPKLTAAGAVFLLAVLAGTMTYSAFLLIGVLADYLGTGRFLAGLLLAALLARFPWIRDGKLRIVGVLPKPARRPVIVGLFALCLVHFLSRGEYVPAVFTGLSTAFILGLPWLKRAVVDRVRSSVPGFAGSNPFKRQRSDDMVIEGEFRERKD